LSSGQEEEPGANGPDGGADGLGAVRSQIVHDDDVAWLEGWDGDLFDIEQEALAIDRPLDQPGATIWSCRRAAMKVRVYLAGTHHYARTRESAHSGGSSGAAV
jgi:hypothetical protein